MKKWFLFTIGCILLAGCTAKESQNPNPPVSQQPPNEKTVTIEDYYPLENKTYTFKGEGNEFAAYKESFFTKVDNYLPAIIENGGTRIFKVYELAEDGIFVVFEQGEYYEETPPPIDSVKSQFDRTPLLTNPLSVGATFDGWEIIKIDERMVLPIGEVNNVIVVEQKDEENHTVITNYLAPGYGKIKQEFVSTEGDGEFKVVSEVEKVE